MLKKDLIKKNPLRVINPGPEKDSDAQRMGLIIARAGVGKTAIVIQIALDSLLRGNQVLHVSIGQSLDKTRTWYVDLFKAIAKTYQLENMAENEEEIMRNRMIMTFNETSFSAPKLKERLNDFVAQGIFDPRCLIIDGFDFTTADRETIEQMRDFVYDKKLQVWFTANTHREDTRSSAAGVPAPCHEVDDLFDTIIILKAEPKQNNLFLNIIKDATGRVEPGQTIGLDPATLLLKNS